MEDYAQGIKQQFEDFNGYLTEQFDRQKEFDRKHTRDMVVAVILGYVFMGTLLYTVLSSFL